MTRWLILHQQFDGSIIKEKAFIGVEVDRADSEDGLILVDDPLAGVKRSPEPIQLRRLEGPQLRIGQALTETPQLLYFNIVEAFRLSVSTKRFDDPPIDAAPSTHKIKDFYANNA